MKRKSFTCGVCFKGFDTTEQAEAHWLSEHQRLVTTFAKRVAADMEITVARWRSQTPKEQRMTSPIETNNVVERRKGQLTVLLAMVEADIQRTSETESFMVRAGLLRDIILENQFLSDHIDVLRGEVNNCWLQWKADEWSAEDAMNAIFDAAFPSASLTQGGKNG